MTDIEYTFNHQLNIKKFIIGFCDTLFDTLNTYFTPLNLIITIFTFVIMFLFHSYIHEYSHYICTINTSHKTKEFTKKLNKTIYRKGLFKIHIKTNYFRFLALNPYKYKKQIKTIARAGSLYSSILYLSFFIISLILSLKVHHLFYCTTFSFLLILIVEYIEYLVGFKEIKNHKGQIIRQPDRFLVNNPTQFKNIHDIKYKRNFKKKKHKRKL